MQGTTYIYLSISTRSKSWLWYFSLFGCYKISNKLSCSIATIIRSNDIFLSLLKHHIFFIIPIEYHTINNISLFQFFNNKSNTTNKLYFLSSNYINIIWISFLFFVSWQFLYCNIQRKLPSSLFFCFFYGADQNYSVSWYF